jgi:hypothetical protein
MPFDLKGKIRRKRHNGRQGERQRERKKKGIY